jgi:glycosyltransferase involved in cell wall biosynthesis
LKVVWVSHTAGLSGAEICFWEAAKGLVSAGHAVHAVLPARGLLSERLEKSGVIISIIPHVWWVHHGWWPSLYYRPRRFLRHLRDCRDIAKYLREINPDLVVTNTLAIPAGAIAAKWVGVPHVWYIHEFGKEDHGLSFDLTGAFSCYLINKLSDKVIVNSRAVLGKFQKKLAADKSRLVYYAVEVPSLSLNELPSNKAFELIIVGQLQPRKRQEEAICATSKLINKGLDIHLTILGYEYKEYGTYLRGLIKKLGLDRHVNMIPFTDNPFSYIASSDVLLMCSQAEAFGRVTVEAMKLGKPVIGADCAGTIELIDDGVNGLLYRSGDVDDLADKIEELYQNRTRLITMGREAKKWSERTFSPAAYVSSLLNVFDEVVGNHLK